VRKTIDTSKEKEMLERKLANGGGSPALCTSRA
jgi:hypothetical protein